MKSFFWTLATTFALGIALAISGCGSDAFNGLNSSATGASSSSAGGSVFQPGGAGGPGSGSTNQPVSGGPGSGSTNQPVSGAPAGGTVPVACSNVISALSTVLAGIPGVQTNTYFGTCGEALTNFVVNSSTGSQYSGGDDLQFGVNCKDSDADSGSSLLGIYDFDDANVRQANSTDYICMFGSTPSQCSPTSSDFIVGFTFGANNFLEDGETSQTGIVTEVLLPGNVAYNFSGCSGVGLESPLVIEEVPGKGIITLNPLSTNTYFDLAGNGAKSRISCVKSGSFLVLPNQNGEVLNINQLFGNNTVGPDGQKSANGFLALGKYDSNGDGMIDSRDPIFGKLMLWQDANCDGIAQASELSPLSSKAATGIKWSNAIQMHEVDQWGNATEERNVVDLTGGRLSRIFDLWFKVY